MSSVDDVHEQDGDPTGVAGPVVQPDVAALYNRHKDAMRASAQKTLAPNSMSSDVDDAVSAVVVNLQNARSRGELHDKDDWEPYLRRSVRNAALVIVSTRAKTDSLDEVLETINGIDTFRDRTEGLDPVAEQVIERGEHQDVRAAISRAGLTDKQQHILCAYFTRGMTDEAIGDQLGVTGQAVGRMRRRAQNTLKAILEGGETT